ncbi:MAG: LamG domain-containing protein [Acidobacteria bacterium]|nr:LamG domain-containing protein [Acidobacteriota bacterium]MDA1236678.1 LamG domain-containing protein [Acidobacteriota bacterium]
MIRWSRLTSCCAIALALGCTPAVEQPADEAVDLRAELSGALTFHAGFDGGLDAAFAQGNRRMYFAPSYTELDQRSPAAATDEVTIAAGQGRYGDALHFTVKNTKAVFFSADRNVAFSPQEWSGTVSFWLSVDPATDLAPGYTDPIQVTDSAYNDNAIWVDFTDQNPRSFRLGVFGELDSWNPGNIPPNDNPNFLDRLVVVSDPPFAGGRWTHVAVVYRDLGGGDARATLYLDGVSQGTSEGIAEPFGWDLTTASIRVGVNYIGLMDDLAVFDRPLSAEQIETLRSLEGGVADLRR